VILLDPEERFDPSQKLSLVERLGNEFICPSFERFDLLLVAGGRDHDDGESPRGRILAQASTYLIPIHLGHLDIQENEIRRCFIHRCQSLLAGHRPDHLIPSRTQHRLKQADVLRGIVHHEYPWQRISHSSAP